MSLPDEALRQQEWQAYLALAHPVLVERNGVPAGRVVHDEGTARDVEGGIDYTVVSDQGPVHVALRVQHTGDDWRNMTIRWRTGRGAPSEFDKRARAVWAAELGGLGQYPALTVQVYLAADLSRFLAAYVAQTRALYLHVLRNGPEYLEGARPALCTCVGPQRRNPEGGALFYAVEYRSPCTSGVLKRVSLDVPLTRPVALEPDPEPPQLGLWGEP